MRKRETSRRSRRRFLAGAGAAGALGFPALVRAQGVISMRWQSAWPAKDIFHEYALDFAKKVGDLTGDELRIEMLPADTVVPATQLLEAVGKGALDGAHGLLSHHYGKHPALVLWGSGPAFGMDANMLLAWHKYGGGNALLAKIYDAIGANVAAFLYGPMPTQPLGWFKKRITKPGDLNGLTIGIGGTPAELFAGLGVKASALTAGDIASAVARGLPDLDAVENNNPTSDRALGLPRVAKVYMMRSYHQNAEQFEILLNKAKFDALPSRLRAVIANAVEAASADMSWKAIDRYSQDYVAMLANEAVVAYATPDSVLRKQLEAHEAAASTHRSEPLFREIEESQRQFAARAVRWYLATQASPRLAYDYYFRRKPVVRRPRRKTK
ncbi:MAG: C4-dicarboxylate ABC transporter [Betaproteobacteria bacterium]|nr:MAG: C4-dicarboxylate ABC transporter [Betaproteobacteria bacterium]